MKNFTVHTKSSKYHISAKERDELLIVGDIERISDTEFRHIAKPRIYNSLQALADWKPRRSGPIKRYIGLSCIFEFAGKRRIEHEFSPDDAAIRLQSSAGQRLNSRMFFRRKVYAQPKIDLSEMAHQYQATFEANQRILNDFMGKLRKDDAIDVEFSVISPDSAPNKPQTALQLRNGN